MFTLVEGFRNLPREDSVDGAHDDEYRGIREGNHIAGVDVVVADEQVVLHCGVVVHRTRGIDDHPDRVN